MISRVFFYQNHKIWVRVVIEVDKTACMKISFIFTNNKTQNDNKNVQFYCDGYSAEYVLGLDIRVSYTLGSAVVYRVTKLPGLCGS